MEEYVSRKDTSSDLCNLLFEWKKATTDRPGVMDDDDWDERDLKILTGQKALNEKMNAMFFLKRSGEKFEPYRQELYNVYSNGQDNFLLTVQEQHPHLDAWKPVYSPTVRKTGSSFVQEGDTKKKERKR